MNYIYALCDPRDNQIRYIGKTDNPERRLRMHLTDKDHCHRVYWIQSLLALGLRPTVTILETVPHDLNWEDRERFWIKHYRDLGYKLTNMSDGGDCGPDCKGKHLVKSEQGRKNIIAALVKRNGSAEMRAASRLHGLANKGKHHTPEEIEKMRIASTGRKHTEEFRRRLAERNRQMVYTREMRQRRQEMSRRLWDDPIKGARARAALVARNVSRRGTPNPGVFNPNQMRDNARKLWDDPVKGAEARARLAERNRLRHNKAS